MQWKPLNVIALVQNQADNINRMIIITESTSLPMLIGPTVCEGGSF